MIYAQLSSKIHAVHSKVKAITEGAVESSYHLISFKALPKLLFANIRAGAHIGLNSFYKRIPRPMDRASRSSCSKVAQEIIAPST